MLASSIADVPLGFKGLNESPYHVHATAVRLKKRRNAKNPVMPMPSKAIEVGSGTVVKVALMALNVKPVVAPEGRIEPVPTPADVTTKSATPEDDGVKVRVSVSPLKVGVKPGRVVDSKLTLEIGAVKPISRSVSVPPDPEKEAVTICVAAWLGEANAKLARSPAASDRNSDRFIMETPGKLISKVLTEQLAVANPQLKFSSIPARLDLMTKCSSRNELGHRSDERDGMRTVKTRL